MSSVFSRRPRGGAGFFAPFVVLPEDSMGFIRRRSGFTLIELLTVCAILAAVSYVAWGAYLNVDRRAEDELAHAELLRLADALRRFHDDTGYWPGEGPFQLNENCSASGPAAVNPLHTGPYYTGAGAQALGTEYGTLDHRKKWFNAPANLSLLFRAPVLCGGHPLAFLGRWNAETHRGWHGPYLPAERMHWVDLLPAQKLVNLPAFGAGPAFSPNGADGVCNTDLNRCALNWKMRPAPPGIADMNGDGADDLTGYNPSKHEFARHARPFLFLLHDGSTPPRTVPRVVYAGADGRYGGINPTDPCLSGNTADGHDDVVICL